MQDAVAAGHPDLVGEALDAQYFMRGAVPDWKAYLDGWTADSAAARARLRGTLDISYGPSAEETLDVFLPEDATGPAPVQILIHGGYWKALGKDDFSFLAPPLAAAGILSVVVNYALCPTVTMTELVSQCRRAVRWTRANIAGFGGDPDRLHVTGHSAGGHLAAMMAATSWEDQDRAAAPVLRSVTALSGLYDLAPVRACFVQEDLRLTDLEVTANSPMEMALPADTSLLLAAGADETPAFRWHTSAYAARRTAQGLSCFAMEVPGRHHYSVVNVLCEPNAPLQTAWLQRSRS